MKKSVIFWKILIKIQIFMINVYMNEDIKKEFDDFFVKNYNYLLGFSKSINPKADYESLLQDCYIKCVNRIEVNGYTGSSFLNYTRVVIMNQYKSNYRNKKHIMLTLDEPIVESETECLLQLNEINEEQQKERDKWAGYVNTYIYDYVEKYYSPKEIFIFKTYFKLRNKKINYEELSDLTGYSVSTVSNIIKRIKKDIKFNINIYIKTNMNADELTSLIDELGTLLKKDITSNWDEYMSMYQRINGTKWNGCKCKSFTLKKSLEKYYNENKNLIV